MRQKLAEARCGEFLGPEMKAVEPVLRIQEQWSCIPNPDELLIEWIQLREGYHYFVYPFAGRLAHEGLAALVEAPPDLTDSWHGPYIKRVPLDKWGNAYIYKCPGERDVRSYDVVSVGKDGVEGTADDIDKYTTN